MKKKIYILLFLLLCCLCGGCKEEAEMDKPDNREIVITKTPSITETSTPRPIETMIVKISESEVILPDYCFINSIPDIDPWAAFGCNGSSELPDGIWLYHWADGSLEFLGEGYYIADGSPDNSKLLLADNVSGELSIIDINDPEHVKKTIYSFPPGELNDLVWAPSSEYFAVILGKTPPRLRVITPDGQELVTVSDDIITWQVIYNVFRVHWSNDGRHLAFSSGFGGQLWVVDVAANTPKLLFQSDDVVIPEIFWSPDNIHLGYTNFPQDKDQHLEQMWVVDINTGDRSLLLEYDGQLINDPNWSPDGNHIYILGPRHDRSDLVLSYLDLNTQELTTALEVVLSESYQIMVSESVWSPSGRYFAVVANGYDVWIIDTTLAQAQLIYELPGHGTHILGWAPNEEGIYVYHRNSHPPVIKLISIY
jgi:Tol biopolymer transport system component